MIMWIMALVLVALCVVAGYRGGATRSAFTFVGLLLACGLAIPLGAAFKWPFPLMGLNNELFGAFGGPAIAFVVVSLVVRAGGEFVHRKIDYHFRYERADAERAVWEVMHRRVGACLGAINGTIYFVVIALVVSVFGYFTIQTGGGENNSKVLSYLGKAAEDLTNTRMDKVVAPFNPASERYFDGSDIAGLLYHNRGLLDRLYNYPVFASMAEEKVFKELGANKELQAQIKGSASLNEILANPAVQEVVSNTGIATNVMALDFKDLKQYLETGVSPKFAAEKILGRWRYDPNTTIQLNKQANPEVGAGVWSRIKKELVERFDNSMFTAFYDNKAKFVLAANMEGKSSPLRAVASTTARGQTNYFPMWFTTNAMYSATGKWSGSAPNYLITLGNKDGTATGEGKLEGDKLSFQLKDRTLAFTRLPD